MASRSAADRPFLPVTSYAVLGLLSFGGARSGYELKKMADHSLRFFFWSPAMSNIYAELKRLRGLEMVVASEVPHDDLRNKRVFSITSTGLEELRRWLRASEVERPVVKEHGILRLWLGHVADRDRLVEVLEEQAQEAEATLASIRYSLAAAEGNAAWAYPWLVERFAERVAVARVEAFAELLADLRQGYPEGRATTKRAASSTSR